MLPYSSQHGKTMPLARASAEKIADRLLKVTPRHNAEYALEQASVLLDCVYKMTLDAGVDGNGKIVWRTHYLSGIAKAPVEDIARDDDGTRSLVLLDHGWEAGRVPPTLKPRSSRSEDHCGTSQCGLSAVQLDCQGRRPYAQAAIPLC